MITGCILQSSGSHDHIVDLQDHPHDLSGKGQCALCHEGRLKHVFLFHVDDVSLADADTRPGLALRVPVPQLSDNGNRADTCVFCKGVGDDFECLGVGPENDGLQTLHLSCALLQLAAYLQLGRAATSDQGSAFDQGANDTEGVVDGAVGFIDDEGV